ncbi:unnamed protein product, partial [Ilex paraguariensis]
LGGPTWDFQLGRRDSTTASLSAANNDLPGPSLDLSALISAFAKKGFTAHEIVTLSGAHTIGQSGCRFFRNRIYNEKNINTKFATLRKSNCPRTSGDNNLTPFDVTSPVLFDNAYFGDLVIKKGLLHSNHNSSTMVPLTLRSSLTTSAKQLSS